MLSMWYLLDIQVGASSWVGVSVDIRKSLTCKAMPCDEII